MNRNKRISLLILTLIVAASSAVAQPKKAAPPVKEYTIEQFMNTVRIGGSSFSADEKSMLFHSNKSGIFNVYSVAVTGGALSQLTNSTKESTFAVSYFPTDARFLYTYDRGGNENSHLYLRELDGSERDLTPGDKVKANFLGWSHDRKSFFFSTNERDARYFDVYEMPIDTFRRVVVHRLTPTSISTTPPRRSRKTSPRTRAMLPTARKRLMLRRSISTT
jgi:hypothetical protein